MLNCSVLNTQDGSLIVIYSKSCYVSPHMSEMEIKEPKNTWFL